MLTSAAWATPSPSNGKGRPGKSGQSTIFNNSDADISSNTARKFQQPIAPRDTLTVPKGAAVDLLRMAALTFSNNDLLGAQRFYEKMMLARSAWLARHKKTLPDPDWLDRQRYGTKRREAVNG